jgi:hypothetical protein
MHNCLGTAPIHYFAGNWILSAPQPLRIEPDHALNETVGVNTADLLRNWQHVAYIGKKLQLCRFTGLIAYRKYQTGFFTPEICHPSILDCKPIAIGFFSHTPTGCQKHHHHSK